jgi:hypothetical protein
LIKSVGVGASRLAKLGAETKAANKMLKFFKSSKELLVKVWEKYPDATAAIERVSEAVERAGAAGTRIGTRALYWLGTVDRMSDKGAVMIIGFIQRLDVAMADRWMARWVALPSGARAVAGGFDAAAAKFGEEAQVAESLHHWLVTTADVEDAAAASRLANRASQADLEAIAARLQRDIDDTRYPARAQGQVGSLEADPTTVPMTPDSAEGFASILAKVCP